MKEKFPEDYELDFCKGHYLQYSGKSRDVLRTPKLLYPAPEPGLRGLGIHLTIDMEGMLRFGPDTLYVNSLDYSFVSSI
jgi:L-2-hydroxyglutarate oxidase LhgO